MGTDVKARKIKQLKSQRLKFENDPLEIWIREYAYSLGFTSRRAALVKKADEIKANNKRAIRLIDAVIAQLEDD